jgi:hypothetical protein
MARSQFPNTYKLMNTYGNSVVNEMKTRIKGLDKIATGELFNSLDYKIVETKDDIELYFIMADYGYYVDKGTKPSKYYKMKRKRKKSGKTSPFIQALMVWCSKRGIEKSAAFAIRMKIWRDGIKASNFYTISTTRRQKKFTEDLEKAQALDFEYQLQQEIKAINKQKRK